MKRTQFEETKDRNYSRLVTFKLSSFHSSLCSNVEKRFGFTRFKLFQEALNFYLMCLFIVHDPAVLSVARLKNREEMVRKIISLLKEV